MLPYRYVCAKKRAGSGTPWCRQIPGAILTLVSRFYTQLERSEGKKGLSSIPIGHMTGEVTAYLNI
jgi:hypothetical protein